MKGLSMLATVFCALCAVSHAYVAAPPRAFGRAAPTQQPQQRRTALPTRGGVIVMNKTPLVFGKKRMEFAPGSSLLAACNKLGMKVVVTC